MKTILRLLKFAAIGAGSLVILVMLVSWWGAREIVDTVFIPNVDFSSADFLKREFTKEEASKARLNFDQLKEPFFMSNFHWLKDGNKYAILFRSYSQGLFYAMDDERFSQVTVVVPTLEPGSYEIDGSDVRSFFTKGSSAWPDGQCGAAIKKGTLKILTHSGGRLKATIQFEVECDRIRMKRPEQIKFDHTYSFQELQFKDASGWLGKKGNHIYRETYR